MRTRLSAGTHWTRLRRRVRRAATHGWWPVGHEAEVRGVRRVDQAREKMIERDPRI